MGRSVDAWDWLRSMAQRARFERDLDEEIRFHVQRQTEDLIAVGVPPDEARRQALIRFGGVQSNKDHARDQRRGSRLAWLARDLQYAWRALWRAPGFTWVAVLILAIGIGATTAMFSIVNGVLLRPLPYPHHDRLIELVHTSATVTEILASPALYFGYRDNGRVFAAVGLWNWNDSPVTVSGMGEPESVPSVQVTHEVLSILGGTAVLGRTFRASDDAPGAPPPLILSHGYWQRRFGGADPVGRTLVVGGVPRQIVGVLPRSFRFFDYDADLYYPLRPDRAAARFPGFGGRGIARLKEGVTLAQANADAARVIAQVAQEFGRAPAGTFRITPALRPLKDSVVGDVGGTLWILLGTIALLLAIACADVANLLLVRTQARSAELIVRAALGAGWTAIARILVAESVLLSAAGGVAGLGVAYVSLPLLVRLGGDDLPGVMAVTIDATVLAVAFGATLLTSLVCALVPLVPLATRKLPLVGVLRASGRVVVGARPANRIRQGLVVAQVAVALVLLIGAGLMTRTFVTLRTVDPGFHDPEGVLTFVVTLPRVRAEATPVAARERMLRTQRAIAERLAHVAGVESVGFASGVDPLPLDGDGSIISILPYIDGRQPVDGVARAWESQRVAPGFFETMRTGIVAGRAFAWRDLDEGRSVMMVSESVARREWGSTAAAVGRRISPGPGDSGSEVIGVFQDVHHDGVAQPAAETVALPLAPGDTATYVVRSARVATPGFVSDLRTAVWAVDPSLSLARVRTLGELYANSMARTSMALTLLIATGIMALVLGLIGIYGVVSHAVSQRRNEIGVRLALGARQGDIRAMFVKQALILVLVGVAVGLGAASAVTRFLESQLFGVRPLDPATHVGVALVLAAVGVAASYVSARRGTTLDPATVLRGE
jgi:putative ABC transport system permease protein